MMRVIFIITFLALLETTSREGRLILPEYYPDDGLLMMVRQSES